MAKNFAKGSWPKAKEFSPNTLVASVRWEIPHGVCATSSHDVYQVSVGCMLAVLAVKLSDALSAVPLTS